MRNSNFRSAEVGDFCVLRQQERVFYVSKTRALCCLLLGRGLLLGRRRDGGMLGREREREYLENTVMIGIQLLRTPSESFGMVRKSCCRPSLTRAMSDMSDVRLSWWHYRIIPTLLGQTNFCGRSKCTSTTSRTCLLRYVFGRMKQRTRMMKTT